jgi:hypothetical protein
MKALPMLDHVMLWMARVFIALALGATIYDSFFNYNLKIENCLLVGLAVLWFVCILQFKRLPCRVVLGISSLVFLVSFSQSFLPMTGFVATFWTAIRAPYIQKSASSSNSVNSV